MWMMGYNEGGEFNNMAAADSFNAGRKLRPLIPRPFSCTAPGTTTATNNNNNNNSTKAIDAFSLNHHLAATMATEQSKRELMNPQPMVVSSRWNPTPEQLRVLEDLYRRGTRTPSADQIQHITAQLRRFGKIEGKNVFYWFQNHKARERQKRRRQMESSEHNHQGLNNLLLNDSSERKDTGSSRTAYEVEKTSKNWISSTSCTAQAEESVSIARATKAVMAAECRAENRWVQINGEEILLQDRRNFMGSRNATWQMMHLPPLEQPTHRHHHLILNSTSVASIASSGNITTSTSAAGTTAMVAVPILSASQVFLRTRAMDTKGVLFDKPGHQDCAGDGESHHQTLQLFPLTKEEDDHNNGEMNEKETQTLSGVEAMNGSNCFAHGYHFYEFLPVKN